MAQQLNWDEGHSLNPFPGNKHTDMYLAAILGAILGATFHPVQCVAWPAAIYEVSRAWIPIVARPRFGPHRDQQRVVLSRCEQLFGSQRVFPSEESGALFREFFSSQCGKPSTDSATITSGHEIRSIGGSPAVATHLCSHSALSAPPPRPPSPPPPPGPAGNFRSVQARRRVPGPPRHGAALPRRREAGGSVLLPMGADAGLQGRGAGHSGGGGV